MKLIYSSTIATMVASSALAGTSTGPTDAELIHFAQDRTNAARITHSPIRMNDKVATLCIAPAPELAQEKRTGKANPHRAAYAVVYTTTNAAPMMRDQPAVFPAGSIVLKEKFSDSAGTKTELFTGMVKREPGFNPECGDWEFFTLSAMANKITARGKLESCMDCHIEHKKTDYVTKIYQ